MTIVKKVGLLVVIILVLILASKLFMFYIPFLIAYVISLLVEPVIKWVHKKTDFSRKELKISSIYSQEI